jgi:beta-1,2-mannobiose phosphorylase / 1,2-beta-oligomannan phosphorylase
MLFADTSRGRPFSKDPAVVFFQDQYWLYYSKPPFGDGRDADGWAIGIATSRDLEAWNVVGEILPSAEYEKNGLCAPGAIVLAEQIHLFYQTYGNGRRDAICHATSSDGLTFQRDPSNPVFSPSGAWNCGRAIDADVITLGADLWLYFATRDPEMKIQMLGVASAPLTSGFGRAAWTQRCAAPILKPELPWEMECIEAPALARHGQGLFLFYGGAYNNSPQQIGVATSLDGVNWTRLSDQPFLSNGAPGEWNAGESGHPFFFHAPDQRDYLFFQGDCDGGKTWYLSRLEIGWRKQGPYVV